MKRKSLLFILLIALFAPLAMNGQQTFTIGTGTNYSTGASSNFTPGSVMGNTYNYYAITQTIYTASEISAQSGTSGAKTITSVAFYHNAYSFTSNITIYLAHTSNSTISGSSAITSGTANYTGSSITVGGSSAGWQTFTLDTPFEYDGTSNLLVVVVRSHSSGFKTSQGWQYTSTSSNYRHIVRSSDTAGYGTLSNGNSTYSYTQSYNRPNIQIGYTTSSSCASGCECFEDCTALTGTGSGGSGSTPTANLPSGWKGYGADYYPFAASFTSYMGSDSDGQFMYFKATDSNATFLALPNQYVTEVNFDYAYETNAYTGKLHLEIGYMTDISSSTWYNNTFYSLQELTNNGATWDSETVDFSNVAASTYYVVFKFSQTQGSWYSAAIDNVCVTTNAPDPCDKTIPYTYGFEDATDYNNCWTNSNLETCSNNSSMGGGIYNNSSYANNGSKLFIFSSYCGETDPQYLISPKLRGVQNGVHVEFDYAIVDFAQGAPETFKVGYSTTNNNLSSFTWSGPITCTSSTYEHFSANFMGQVKYIAVQYTSADSYYLFLDDFIIEEAPNCLEPTNVLASNETTTSATIGWTAGGSETEWDLYYTSNPSDVPTASTTPSISGITTNSRNLTSLTAATTYYVYVRAACSSTETSAWSTPCIFNTECEGMTLPYTETFEAGDLTVCWTTINESPVYMSTEVSNTSPYAGTYHLNLDRRTTQNHNQIVVLPEVSSDYALSNFEVSFYAMLAAGSTSGSTASGRTLTVGVMTDPDDASTFVAVGSAVEPGTSYAQYTFDLSSYTGNGQYIAIKHDATSNGYTYIDNLEVTALPCPVPAGLNVTNLTAASVTLNWTGDQSSYNVRYRSYTQGEPQEQVFEEGFEGGSMPSGWDNSIYTGSAWNVGAGTGHTNSSITATTTSATGSYNAYYYNSTSSNSAYLILPALDLSNASVATLTFNYVNPAWSGGYYALTVYYRINGGSWNQLSQYTTSQNTWTGKTVTLTGLADNYQVAFYVTGYNSDYGHGVGIDDVKITYTAPSINYSEWINKPDVTSPLNINGLTPMTDYEWQVQGVNCDGNGGTTDWSAPATFTTLEGYTLEIEGYETTLNTDGTINRGGYYLIASPVGEVAPANVTNMIPANSQQGYDLYSFDPTQTNEWVNYRPASGSSFTQLEPGKGYLYANQQDVILVFNGPAYTTDDGTFDVTLTKAAAVPGLDFPDWNLVGNPFAVKAWIDRGFYTLNSDLSLWVSVESEEIEAMQGIFVVAGEDGETLTFTTTDPNTEGKRSMFALNLSHGRNLIDRAIVRLDGGRQLPKLQFIQGSTKVYIPVDGQDYAIVSCEEMGEMPVSFKAEENGSYNLSLNSENVSFAYLHLIDNLTGKEVDLLETPSYSFEAKTTDYANRFKLVFATGDNSNDDNFAFFSNGSFIINNDGAATLQVIDITGRIVKSESINGCTNVNVNAAPGVYMLRLINGDNVKVQKVVVK